MKSTRVRYHGRKTRKGVVPVREHQRFIRGAPELYNVVGVIVNDARISKWLKENDPKAFEQAKSAFEKAGGDEIVLGMKLSELSERDLHEEYHDIWSDLNALNDVKEEYVSGGTYPDSVMRRMMHTHPTLASVNADIKLYDNALKKIGAEVRRRRTLEELRKSPQWRSIDTQIKEARKK